MKRYRIILSDKAKQELRIIDKYISDSLGAYWSNIVLKRIYKRIDELSYSPGLKTMPSHPDIHTAHARKYRILYKVDDAKYQVEILHVISSKTDLRKVLG